jgi:WD40 repeat protein
MWISPQTDCQQAVVCQLSISPCPRRNHPAAAFVPEGEHVLSVALPGYPRAANPIVELWDVRSGRRLSADVAGREWTMDLAFSPDGKFLASANSDNTARLWHVPSGKVKADLTGHTLAVFGVGFSRDSRTLATAGGDAAKLWNVETGQELMTLAQKGTFPAFSPDGRVLAFADDRWPVDT